MNVKMMKIEELVPYEKNPRKNDGAVKYVMESIKEFGFKVPIVIDKNNVIVTGHTRYKASKNLKLSEVPCIIADDLTDEQIKAFRLADNKVSEYSEWDMDLLDFELEDLELDMTEFGFDNIIDDIEVDIPKESKENADGVTQQEYLKYSNNKIPISEDEIMQLDEKLKNYQDEYGTSFGFIRSLLDEIH